ncbi:AAA family ATPase [Pontiellaceae bacterium B1224]|nr:AAA family ATPase [Pontiellaceae bacterium B1224]
MSKISKLARRMPGERVLEIVSGDFPLESRLAEYALGLLELNQLGRMLIVIVFSILPPASAIELAALFKGEEDFQGLEKNLIEAEDADDLSRIYVSFLGAPSSRMSLLFTKALRPLLKQQIKPARASYRRRVEQLCRKMNLSADEIALLELGCCYSLNPGLERLLDSFNTTKKVGLFSFLTGVSRGRISLLISNKEKLVRNEWLTLEARNLRVNDSVFEYLIGNAGKDFAADAFKPIRSAELSLDHFDLKPVQKETLAGVLGSAAPNHILFYGKAGTGKTELAKVLVQQSGKEAVVVNYGSDGDARDRKTALFSTINSVPEDTLIIVDEVDGLLNTQSLFRTATVNKGWINQFMDDCRHKMIWIVNESGGIEESVRRRFSYSLQFRQLTWRQRETIWLTQLRKHRIKRFFQTLEIQQLAKRFPVSPGLIAYSAKTMKQCQTNEMTAPEVHAMLDEILTRQMELTEGTTPDKKLAQINSNYDPAALNTDFDPTQLIKGLSNWQNSKSEYGINLLFWGWPGTGKTEFAKYMAEQLGKELLVKRMSDLQSMYVGQTEKLIAAAFREAEENDAVLFLDEADSLFINRHTAHRSWEASQTNEVLTQMENFKGILICCTNLLEHLDEAAMRRFAFKVKFLPLTNDGKVLLYRKYFSAAKGALTRMALV